MYSVARACDAGHVNTKVCFVLTLLVKLRGKAALSNSVLQRPLSSP